MKTVLHIRIDSPGYNSNAIEKAFVDNGFSYYGFEWQTHRFNFGVDGMRDAAIHLAKKLQPTIIFMHVQNKEAFSLESYQVLQKIGFVINYTFDARNYDEIAWMYEVAKHIGHTFFSTKEDVDYCIESGINNVSHSHSSCDMELFKPKPTNNFAFDVSFCGNKYDTGNLKFPLAAQRQGMIASIKKNYPNNFGCFGLGQPGGMIRAEAEVNVYNYSKIAINQNNFLRQDYTSDRLWRIMASGCFCLSAYFPGIENLFEKEVHIDWFNNFDEMNGLIKFYLNDEKERQSIAEMGCQLVRENHTWTSRIGQMLKEIKFNE